MMERSLFSARHCFVENLHDSGKMSDAEFSVLCEWFDFLASGNLSSVDVGVDLIIYLRTEPEVAYERKKSRARKEEEVCFNVINQGYFGGYCLANYEYLMWEYSFYTLFVP